MHVSLPKCDCFVHTKRHDLIRALFNNNDLPIKYTSVAFYIVFYDWEHALVDTVVVDSIPREQLDLPIIKMGLQSFSIELGLAVVVSELTRLLEISHVLLASQHWSNGMEYSYLIVQ